MNDKTQSQILDTFPQSNQTTQNFSVPIAKKQASSTGQWRTLLPTTKKQAPPQQKRQRILSQRRLQLAAALASLLIIVALGLTAVHAILSAPLKVTAFQVGKRQNTTQFIGGGGIVYPRQQLDLSYPVAERVLAVLVKAGDQVKPNQPLIKLDPTQLNTQITQASNDVAAAQAYLSSVSNAFPYNAVTVAAAQQALQVAQNRYNALVAQASSPTLHGGNIISPVQGVVTAVNVNAGEVFGANVILLTLMDQSTAIVRAKVPLSNLTQIHVGMPAQVTPSALPNLTFNGSVTSIIPQADPQTDTFEVWVQVNNAQQTILPGMSAFVRIQSQVSAFVVPHLSVLNPDRESAVFVIRNAHAVMQPVHVVGRSVNSIYIDSGITANDKIVVLPLDQVHDGQTVTITQVEQ